MDPISLLVTALAVYATITRLPGLAGEAMAEVGHARRGEESPAARDRRQRLIDAGIDPATGGPMRQFLANAWRDYWIDQEAERVAGRARRAAERDSDEVRSWRDRLDDRIDEEVTRRANQWRTRPADQQHLWAPSDPDPATSEPYSEPTSGGPAPDPDEDIPEPGVVHEDGYDIPPRSEYQPPPRQSHQPDEPPTSRHPIRVDATVGAPVRNIPPTPAAIAGGTMSSSVATRSGGSVTGVVSGAAEARRIARQLDAATAEYNRQLGLVRAAIHALGEQTVGFVQMSTKSRVVAITVAAAESAAAAQAAAKSCGVEVVPLLDGIAREFDRVNS